MRQTKQLVLLVGEIFVAGIIGMACWVFARAPGPKVHEIFGEEGIEIISKPDRVEVYGIKGGDSPEEWQKTTTMPAEKKIGGYAIVSRGPDVDREMSGRIAGVLLDDKTYPDLIDNCIFDPHAALRFFREGKSVQILVCVRCDDISVVVKDRNGQQIRASEAHFNEGYANLGGLVNDALNAK